MNEDIKAQWIENLTNGRYEQARGSLVKVEEDGSKRFCCLGVLCDMAVQAGVVPEPVIGADGYHYGYGAQADFSVLPNEVAEWAGINNYGYVGNVRYGTGGSRDVTGDIQLSAHNDSGVPFKEIAKTIERLA